MQKTLQQSFIKTTSVLFVKEQSSVSEPLFRGLKGNVFDSSLARLKARNRLPIFEHFSLALTAEEL